MKRSLFVILGLFIFIACKKKDNTTPDSNPTDPGTNNTTTPDFIITTSNINYAVGTTWSYEITTIDDFYNNGVVDPSLSYTNTASYTVTVSRDTIISPGITGKILHYDAPGFDGINNYIREVSYYDPGDLKWHSIASQKYNGGPEVTGCLGIDLPLTSTSKWQNMHANHPSTANDSCFAQGFYTISTGLGDVKCIRFRNKSGSSFFWYNNIYGRVRTENFTYEILNAMQTTSRLTIINLTSFHP
ncbi:MAG: hypothetical protein K0S53_204 [Bacteroidetes bacterium]|jgi:hypothetical protein|nr:hypothetical protein [Bacteroidota bacterium]MDF2452693.1 hypothetical protein [Bacteroidota bacterium]